MNEKHLQMALAKYPLPWIRFVDNPSKEWLLERAINICKYLKELAAAESVNN